MPLIRIETVKGRTNAELELLLDTCHAAVVEAFGVPECDRYQILTEHDPSRMVIEDTGLSIPRTDQLVLVQVFTSPRTREQKERFYRLLADLLERACGVPQTDVMISLTSNSKEDWSFGHGRAQFLTGEL